jgi:rhamnose utilization protein RhaD (predicted bifunctional aldolase and dehydrogenase)
LSPCLAVFKDKSDPKYAEALAIIEAGKALLATRPREDMPGCQLDGLDAAREARYQERARMEAQVRQAILRGEKVYPYKPAAPVQAAGE